MSSDLNDNARGTSELDAEELSDIRVCLDCRSEFGIALNEAAWYHLRKFALPGRCPSCRVRRRDEFLAGKGVHDEVPE